MQKETASSPIVVTFDPWRALTFFPLIFLITSGSILIRALPIPLIAIAVAIAVMALLFGAFPYRDRQVYREEISAGTWTIGFLFVLSLNLFLYYLTMNYPIGVQDVLKNFSSSFATPLGAAFALLMIRLYPGSHTKIAEYCFWTIFIHALVEFVAFNTIPNVNPFNWYYDFYTGDPQNSGVSPNAAVHRFSGVFGFHPGTSALVLSLVGLVLDRKRKTKRFRSCALVIDTISLSGVGYFSALLVLFSLVFEMRFAQRLHSSVKFFGLLAGFAFFLAGVLLLGDHLDDSTLHLSSDYIHYLFANKIDQADNMHRLYLMGGWKTLMFGPDNTLVSEDNLLQFSATDFGLLYRFTSAGLIGLLLYGLQNVFTGIQAFRILDSVEQKSVFIALLILSAIHYSVFNVFLASACLSMCLAASHCRPVRCVPSL